MAITTGSSDFDAFIGGGFEPEILTTIYGPSGSGKTNIALCAAVQCLKKGLQVIYIDTEASFSVTRIEQIMPDFVDYAKNILFLKPTTFAEQKHAFGTMSEKIEQNAYSNLGLIVVDSIAMLYRLELGMTTDIPATNRELGVQLGKLTELTRKKKIPIIITNQVYSDFDNKNNVNMVGGDLLKYTSKCLIELKKAKNSVRVATIVKHRSIAENTQFAFKIINEGIQKVNVDEIKPVEHAYETI